MSEFANQIRHALRNLLRAPLFAAGTILVLSLGIAASAAVFAFVRGILLQPLRYPESSRLLILCETNAAVSGHCVAAPPNAQDWAARARTLAGIGQGREWSFLMRYQNRARSVNAGLATPQLFSVLQVQPLRGRLFDSTETHWDRARVALLSHSFWSNSFGADPGIIGQSIELDGQSFTIVGVLPAGFVVPEHDNVELWVPFHFDPRAPERRSWRGFITIARLAPGATVGQAGAELSAIQQQLASEHPQDNEGWGVRSQTLKSYLVRSVRPRLIVFSAAAALLLLITCVNAAALFLVRVTARQHEFALRLALGANTRVLIRHVLAEGATLGLFAAGAGLSLAWAAVALFVRLAPSSIPRLDEVRLNTTAVLLALGLALLCAFIVSLLPVWRAARGASYMALREGAVQLTAHSGLRLRRMLVVVQIAVALTLLLGSTLLMRSFASLLDWQPGFPRERVLRVSFFAPVEEYGGPARLVPLLQTLEEELAELPGVARVATASAGPLFGGREASLFQVEGRTQQKTSDAIPLRWYDASPDFARVFDRTLLRGRLPDESDRVGQPLVAVINEAARRRYFANQNPIGQRVRQNGSDLRFRIVGVIADVPPLQHADPGEAEIYFSNRQLPRPFTYFIVRTTGDPAHLLRLIEQRLQQHDPDFTVGSAQTLAVLLDRQLIAPRFQMLLLAAFAMVALTLAGAGVFGVLAYAVALRVPEFGIRIALGARPIQLLRGVLQEALALAGLGLLMGGSAALLLASKMTGLLQGASGVDPLSCIVVVTLIVALCLLASSVPAWRAMQVEPYSALRAQ